MQTSFADGPTSINSAYDISYHTFCIESLQKLVAIIVAKLDTGLVRYGQYNSAVSGRTTWNLLPQTVCCTPLTAVRLSNKLKTELFIRVHQ